MIRSNLERVKTSLQEAATKSGRPVDQIRLVAVSKTKSVDAIREAYEAGHRHFGENYVQELVQKAQALPDDIAWHFIGSLQRNKIPELTKLRNLFAIESVDSLQKAVRLDKFVGQGQKLNIFVQVNTSGEATKSGVPPNECESLVKSVLEQCPRLNLMGLMTIGQPDVDFEDKNPDFACLAELAQSLRLKLNIPLELSMGMSDDFEKAIEMGSTNVRVGSLIFGSRKPATE